MKKIQTPEEWLLENENNSIILVEDCMFKYSECLSISFAIWCDENCWFINPENSLWESQLYKIKNLTDKQLFELFKKEKGI